MTINKINYYYDRKLNKGISTDNKYVLFKNRVKNQKDLIRKNKYSNIMLCEYLNIENKNILNKKFLGQLIFKITDTKDNFIIIPDVKHILVVGNSNIENFEEKLKKQFGYNDFLYKKDLTYGIEDLCRLLDVNYPFVRFDRKLFYSNEDLLSSKIL